MRAFVGSLVIATAAIIGFASPAAADYCGASGNGCAHNGVLTPEGSCAGHGAFGAFGEKGDVYHDFRGGANGDATAFNNSTLCGRPQGAAGELNP